MAKLSMNSQLSQRSLTHYKKGIRSASWSPYVRLEHLHFSHFKRVIMRDNAEEGRRGKVKKAGYEGADKSLALYTLMTSLLQLL
jgi:hypothetical protein